MGWIIGRLDGGGLLYVDVVDRVLHKPVNHVWDV